MAEARVTTKPSAQTESLRETINRIGVAMVLTDPGLNDNPIVYVNDAFERVTLYSREYAVGRNCRFLQGPDTDPADIARIRDALAERKDVSIELTNYKADGSPFRNRLLLAPIYDTDQQLEAFLGVQQELREGGALKGESLPDAMMRELQHRVKNHLAMIVSMIRMQANQEITRASFDALSYRVESLALLYEELSPVGVGSAASDTIPGGAYLSRVTNTLGALDGRPAIRLNVDCEEISLEVDTAARLGLLLTEFLTNAFEHAFKGRQEGMVRVRFQALSGNAVRLMVEDDGVGLPDESRWPHGAPSVQECKARRDAGVPSTGVALEKRASGMGGSIVLALVAAVDGTLNVTSSPHGTVVTLDVLLGD